MAGNEESIINSVQKTASKISEIFSSLVDAKESLWGDSGSTNGNNSNGSAQTIPTKTKSHSLDAFHKRVSTFSPGLWSVRALSPLECARWGWKLLEKDALQCVTCQEVICALLPSSKDKEAYERFFGILKDRLETNHKDACGWLYDPCPIEFVEPLRIDTIEELRNMTNSAHTLAALNSALPFINNNRITAILGADNEVISGLFKNVNSDEDIKTISVLLVLSGWSKGQGAYLICSVCRRQIGLWSYLSVADEKRKTEPNKTSSSSNSKKRKLSGNDDENVEEDNDANRRITRQSPKKLKQSPKAENTQTERMRTRSSGKDDKKDDDNDASTAEMDVVNNECLIITSPSTQVEKVEKQYFNPLEEHRYWCPWIAAIDDGQNENNDDLPKGFCMVTEQVRAVLQISKQTQSDSARKVENVEALRKIRYLLDEVSSE